MKNLKAYNAERKAKRPTASYVYATEHLPKELQKQKKPLMPLFQKAKRNKQKTAWKLQERVNTVFLSTMSEWNYLTKSQPEEAIKLA